jgi:hypothetical protein
MQRVKIARILVEEQRDGKRPHRAVAPVSSPVSSVRVYNECKTQVSVGNKIRCSNLQNSLVRYGSGCATLDSGPRVAVVNNKSASRRRDP